MNKRAHWFAAPLLPVVFVEDKGATIEVKPRRSDAGKSSTSAGS